MTNLVQFPGLGLSFEINRVALSIGGFNIYWYGVCIAFGICLALVFAFRHSIEFGVDPDSMVDVILIGIVLGIASARAYYVAMAPFKYESIWEMIAIRDGGLAIYGAVIGAFVGVAIYCRIKKCSLPALLDLVVMGFLIGQFVGRWGNFCNREAFGAPTMAFSRMGLYNTVTGQWEYYHPTFLYESLWNFTGFLILHFLYPKRAYDGQIALVYCAWYGLGRAMIEGLRMDSLYWGSFRVSQVLAAVGCVAAVAALVFLHFRPHDPEKLAERVYARKLEEKAATEKTEQQ